MMSEDEIRCGKKKLFARRILKIFLVVIWIDIGLIVGGLSFTSNNKLFN